ncbi:glycoside hydrolase family 16 protein [Pedobacter frigidisoli]|uniref:Glycoside hydrolase family 16 protein n=1 Tax=Pedobacter frigidisoli TaxID=2530455 RepID=A0A4R0P3I7_9SPHI|nr:glycoside hydrolase family 16 protein [Pedobacter frigidisoli]TCD11169.1 glycoside hydrolase family 16 protein [Pedobacter frigidisoli]
MKQYLWLGLFSVLLFACSVNKQYNKRASWEENFNQKNSFDTKTWSKIPRGNSDWSRHMSNNDSCYALRKGKMILRGITNNDFSKDTSRYLTGGIYTKSKVAFGMGRLEIRAKLNGAKGAWPAIWMLAENSKWPDGGEIDIMERLNFDAIAYQTIHSSYTVTLNKKDNPKSSQSAKINPEEFNTYAVEKYPDSLVFFINDKKTFTYPKMVNLAQGQFPFNRQNYYLLIDMQLGGSWVGKIKNEDLPVEMEIDWVRFYKFKHDVK